MILAREGIPATCAAALLKQNKADGFMCASCAWAKPRSPHVAESCEKGAKATAWEMTAKRRPPSFFSEQALTALESWSDLELEAGGRLTAPLRYDAPSDSYVEVGWEEAFADIGAELKQLMPESAVFYASGRAPLEASFLYQLFARVYGHNNLPDSLLQPSAVPVRPLHGEVLGRPNLARADRGEGR